MKIGVLVKQVPSGDSSLRVSPVGNGIKEDTVTFTTNESDLYALEEALRLKEKSGNGEVIVASLGPERVQRTLKDALSRGADRAIHIKESFDPPTGGLRTSSSPYTTDPFEIASIFAGVLKDENFDLILSGLQSDDLGMGQTGVILGELLGMSTATLVMATDILQQSSGKAESLKIKRELESGWFQWLTLTLPASITIQSGINSPRYPSLKGIMSAKKKEVRVIEKSQIASKAIALQLISRIYLPQKTKRTEMIEGNADQIVEKLVDVFKNKINVL